MCHGHKEAQEELVAAKMISTFQELLPTSSRNQNLVVNSLMIFGLTFELLRNLMNQHEDGWAVQLSEVRSSWKREWNHPISWSHEGLWLLYIVASERHR